MAGKDTQEEIRVNSHTKCHSTVEFTLEIHFYKK